MRDATPASSRRQGDDGAARRKAQDAADDRLLYDRVVAAFGDIYLVGDEVGRGGMAVVYSATDVRLQRIVALKVLPPDLAFRADVRERFVREAQTAARLNHPHIVPIYAVHEAQGLVCFAMALVRGESLAARILREPRPSYEWVASVLEQTADALAYAHASGVVHRDIKPDNVLLDKESGRAMVTDFGIARAAESGSRLTQTGIAVGTPAFMSPEQATGDREIDGRSDVYSLGVVGYLMLSGRLPFEAATTPAMLVKHLSETPPPIQTLRPGVPRVLADILERCLAKRPDDRWENAMALRDALRLAVRSGFGGALTAPGAHRAVPPPPLTDASRDRDGSRDASRDNARDSSRDSSRDFRDRARDATERAAQEGARRFGNHHADWAPRSVTRADEGQGSAQPHVNLPGYPPRLSSSRFSRPQENNRAGDRAGSTANDPRMALPALPPLPILRVGASRREVKEWERAVREQRHEQKQRWKLEREAQRQMMEGSKTDSRTPEERISRFRFRLVSNVALMGFLGVLNAATGDFPWVIFPVFGMGMGLIGEYAKLRSRGVRWKHILGASTDADASMPVLLPKPQRIATAVHAFKKHLRWFAGSVVGAVGSFAIGSSLNLDPMIVPFVGSLGFGAISAGLTVRNWFRLNALGVSAGDALGDGWHAQLAAADDRPRDMRIRDELSRVASTSLLESRFGDTVRAAVDDRVTIRETSARLSEADRALVPDVEPTADALLERIGALAAGLERLESDLPGNALPALDARIAALEAEPESAPDRERRLTLLQRQRASLSELDERRGTMQRQLENASLALRSLRLDMVKLRTLGVGAAISDVTNATQEARALSKDIGRAVEAADEVRKL